MVAQDGWKLLPDYRFDLATGLWHHRQGPVEPPLRLDQVGYGKDEGNDPEGDLMPEKLRGKKYFD